MSINHVSINHVCSSGQADSNCYPTEPVGQGTLSSQIEPCLATPAVTQPKLSHLAKRRPERYPDRRKWLWISAASGALMLISSPWTIGGWEQSQRESRRPLPVMPANPHTNNEQGADRVTDSFSTDSKLIASHLNAEASDTAEISLAMEGPESEPDYDSSRLLDEMPSDPDIPTEIISLSEESKTTEENRSRTEPAIATSPLPEDSTESLELNPEALETETPEPNQSEDEASTETNQKSEGEDGAKSDQVNNEARWPNSPQHIALRESTEDGERVRIAIFEPDCDIYVHESEHDGIEVRLRRYLFGTCTDQVASAEDAEQLKDKFPEAYKIYRANIGKADLLGGPLSIYPVEEVSWEGPVGFLTAANKSTTSETKKAKSQSTLRPAKPTAAASRPKANKKTGSQLISTKPSPGSALKDKSLKSESKKNKTDKKPNSSTTPSKKISPPKTTSAARSEKLKGNNGEESKAKLQDKSNSDLPISKTSKLNSSKIKPQKVKPIKTSTSTSLKARTTDTGKKSTSNTASSSNLKKKTTKPNDSSNSSKKDAMKENDSRNQVSKTAKENNSSQKKSDKGTSKYQDT